MMQNSFGNRVGTQSDKSLFFDELIHYAFIGKYVNNEIVISKSNRNRILNTFLSDQESMDLRSFVEAIIADEYALNEYIEKIDLILRHGIGEEVKEEMEEHANYYFKFNSINDKHSAQRVVYGIKPLRTQGIKSSFHSSDNQQEEVIYVDLFTIPVFDEGGELIGIQGMIPVVNERKKYFELSQDNATLQLVHHLKNNLRSRVSDSIARAIDLLPRDEFPKPILLIEKAKDNLNRFIIQSQNLLNAFRMRVEKANNLYNTHEYAIEMSSLCETEKVPVSFSNELEMESYCTLPSELLRFLAEQFIQNAISIYRFDEVGFGEQGVELNLIDSDQYIRIEFISRNTEMDYETLRDIGYKPISSSITSSGMGFFLMNNTLKDFKARSYGEGLLTRYFIPENVSGLGFRLSFELSKA